MYQQYDRAHEMAPKVAYTLPNHTASQGADWNVAQQQDHRDSPPVASTSAASGTGSTPEMSIGVPQATEYSVAKSEKGGGWSRQSRA